MVLSPNRRFSSARCMTSRISLMPLVTALKSMKLAWVRPAMMRARVVFPTPGGPQKIMEEMRSWSINCRKIFPSPKRCSCPTNSSRVRGRIRLANGRSIPCCPNKVCCSIRRLRSYRFFYFTTGGRKGQEQSFVLDEAQAGNAKPYIKKKTGNARVGPADAGVSYFPSGGEAGYWLMEENIRNGCPAKQEASD